MCCACAFLDVARGRRSETVRGYVMTRRDAEKMVAHQFGHIVSYCMKQLAASFALYEVKPLAEVPGMYHLERHAMPSAS